MLPYIIFLSGNGNIGMSLNGNRHLYISDGESLSIEIPYESLLTFTVDDRHSQRGKCVGLFGNFCFSKFEITKLR